MDNGDGLTALVAAALIAMLGLVLVTKAWDLAGVKTRPFYLAAAFSITCDGPVWYVAHDYGPVIYTRLIAATPLDPIMWVLLVASAYAAVHPLLLLALYIRHRLLSRRTVQC